MSIEPTSGSSRRSPAYSRAVMGDITNNDDGLYLPGIGTGILNRKGEILPAVSRRMEIWMATEIEDPITGVEALEAAKRHREALRLAMIELEAAIASPSRSPSWSTDIDLRLDRLQAALADHINDVESPQGIISQTVENEPRLASSGDILRNDHVRLTDEVRRMRATLHGLADEPEIDDAAAVRRSILELLGEFSRHRQHGVDFVYDAYNVDIGGDI